MPFTWECRSKHIKQLPAKPTIRNFPISQEVGTPGPNHYEPPKISGGKGFSKIRRAPAYTFGRVIRYGYQPSVSPNAPLFNVRGISARGGYKVPGGLITPYIEPVTDRFKTPGPGTHDPRTQIRTRRVPAYSMRPAAKPPYQPFDTWTPPPNMYCPPIPKPNPPSFTFGNKPGVLTTAVMPGPGEHNPKFDYVRKTKPAYSFGPRYKEERALFETPAPNYYCDKKFMIRYATPPTPSFGIRHSPFLAKEGVHLKPSNIELRISKV